MHDFYDTRFETEHILEMIDLFEDFGIRIPESEGSMSFDDMLEGLDALV